MSKYLWDQIKTKKMFHVRNFRWAVTTLLFSTAANIILLALTFVQYISQPEREFYASSGIIQPIKLSPMSAANDSSAALLEPDPVSEEEPKVIPQ